MIYGLWSTTVKERAEKQNPCWNVKSKVCLLQGQMSPSGRRLVPCKDRGTNLISAMLKFHVIIWEIMSESNNSILVHSLCSFQGNVRHGVSIDRKDFISFVDPAIQGSNWPCTDLGYQDTLSIPPPLKHQASTFHNLTPQGWIQCTGS